MTLYEPESYLQYQGGLAPITTIVPPHIFPEQYTGPGLPAGVGFGLTSVLTGGVPSLTPQVVAPPVLPPVLPPAFPPIVPVAAAVVGVAQALGFGEGEGLFGLDILGGGNGRDSVNGIPLGGPGLAEPAAKTVIKEWHVSYDWGRLQYYLVQMPTGGRRIALYNTRTKKWKSWAWRAPRLAVIGKNMPSHRMITRLRRNLKKHSADAVTILKMTSPARLEAHHRHPTYGKPHRR